MRLTAVLTMKSDKGDDGRQDGRDRRRNEVALISEIL